MTHLIKQINIKLASKLVMSALLASAIVVTGANAIDSGVETQDRTHLEHKVWLDENTSGDHDDMTLEEYERSQKAVVIADANERLARIKAEAYGRQS